MKIKNNLIKWLALFTLLMGPASAEPLKTVDATKKLADAMIKQAVAAEYVKAFDLAKEHWPIDVSQITGLAKKTQEQLTKLEPAYGKVVGAEYIGKVKLGSSYIRYSYFLKMEKHVLRWNFVFYKPKDTWLINLIHWNDKPHELLPEFGVVEKAKK